MTKQPQRPGLRLVVCLVLLVLAVVTLVLVPEARLYAAVVSLILIATIAFALAQVLDVGPVAQTRVAGAVFLLFGLACAVGAVAVWMDPTSFPDTRLPRLPPEGQITVAILGAVVFGGIGITGLVRAGRSTR